MGRDDHNRKMHRGNNGQLPQSPHKSDRRTGDDIELANELGDRYKLEVKPGFGPTGVERKDS